jgi:hypothetical protein
LLAQLANGRFVFTFVLLALHGMVVTLADGTRRVRAVRQKQKGRSGGIAETPYDTMISCEKHENGRLVRVCHTTLLRALEI